MKWVSLVPLLILVLSGCSFDPSFGYTSAEVWEDSRTVAVPVFENQTLEPGLGVQLTDAVIRELNTRTPWAVTRAGVAQTRLAGTITNVQRQNLSTGRDTGLVSEQAIVVTMDFRLTDLTSGEVIAARRGLSAAGTFVPDRGAGERTEVGRRAAVQSLARSLVDELREGW
ncbi:MAG: LptE family protein [Planctomycetota bacterium]